MRTLLYTLLGLIFFACNSYDENERFEGPVTFEAKKKVLIEDFTGQKCVNCPKAADKIKEMQAAYGEENVIAVGIYTDGNYGLHESLKSGVGLANDEGLAILDAAGVKTFPNGRVDRGDLSAYDKWAAFAMERTIQSPIASVEIDYAEINQNGDRQDIDASVTVKSDKPLNAKLEVWITEDGLVKRQYMPDNSKNDNYVHNHVFRGLLTPAEGQSIELTNLTSRTVTFERPLKNEPTVKWNAEKLGVVAILTSTKDGRVIQVESKKATL